MDIPQEIHRAFRDYAVRHRCDRDEFACRIALEDYLEFCRTMTSEELSSQIFWFGSVSTIGGISIVVSEDVEPEMPELWRGNELITVLGVA